MKAIQALVLLILLCPLIGHGQQELKLLEGPMFGSKNISKLVKQSEEEQKITLTLYYENIPKDVSMQAKAFIMTGGDNPLQDINVALVDLAPGDGNIDISFSFTPGRSYSKPYISSRKVKVLLVKKEKKGDSVLDGIPGISDGGGIQDITAPKYIYLLSKEWRVSPPTNDPNAISNITIPVKLLPFKSARTIKP
ncbi:MAG: hypothetical protein MRZ79_21470 [Bacteroidia bacterium]|nr:hypothetical protein [Bacteroidia bacterium]